MPHGKAVPQEDSINRESRIMLRALPQSKCITGLH